MAFFIRAAERIIEWAGRIVAWFMVANVLIVFLVVVLRYVFGLGWASLQELYIYLHATAFMLGSAYTHQKDRHVRVDIVYGRAGHRYRALTDLLGNLLLLAPVFGWLLYTSLPFVQVSWARLETSHQSGGLPGVFLLKTVIPVTCALLIGQGLCIAWHSLRALRGGGDIDVSD